MFSLVSSAKLGRPSPAQIAYAKFATGDALDADKKHAQAKDEYVESLKAFPRGSWQDETLFRIARYIQNEADKKYGMVTSVTHAKDPDSKEERERLKKLTDASAASLDYWAALVQHFPNSRHRETALVQATRIFAHTHKWSEAVATADKLAAEYPANKSAPLLLFEIGQGLISARLLSDALRMANRLHQTYHNDHYPPILLQDIGLLFVREGRVAGVQEVGERLVSSWPKHTAGPRLLCEAAFLTLRARNWTTAQSLLNRAIEVAPRGAYAGIACLQGTDVCIEQLCDLAQAEKYAALGLEWAKANPKLARAPDLLNPPMLHAPFSGGGFRDMERPASPVRLAPGSVLLRELYVRAGLTLCLAGKGKEALPVLKTADSFMPPVASAGLVFGRSGGLIDAIRRDYKITPEEAQAGDPGAALLLKLADLYSCADDYDKARSLCTRVIEAKSAGITREQKSYAFFRRGRSSYCMGPRRWDLSQAKADYTAGADLAPRAPWAAKGLFLAGNICFNYDRDYDRAITAWTRVLQMHPEAEEAERCAYYLGVAHEARKCPGEARAAFEQFLRKYPSSRFAGVVQSHHLARLVPSQRPAEK